MKTLEYIMKPCNILQREYWFKLYPEVSYRNKENKTFESTYH